MKIPTMQGRGKKRKASMENIEQNNNKIRIDPCDVNDITKEALQQRIEALELRCNRQAETLYKIKQKVEVYKVVTKMQEGRILNLEVAIVDSEDLEDAIEQALENAEEIAGFETSTLRDDVQRIMKSVDAAIDQAFDNGDEANELARLAIARNFWTNKLARQAKGIAKGSANDAFGAEALAGDAHGLARNAIKLGSRGIEYATRIGLAHLALSAKLSEFVEFRNEIMEQAKERRALNAARNALCNINSETENTHGDPHAVARG